jgi:protocatechuate 3,4-dioxygenase beta subunit
VRFFMIAWCILVATAFALQMGSPKATPGLSVQGKVLQEAGTEPIKKANVQLDGGDGHSTAHYSATTDADGRFRIEEVKPGRYTVAIDHPGFVLSGSGKRSTIVLLPGQSTTDVVFHMQPAAVITGKIVDVDGDPMRDVYVTAHLVGSPSVGCLVDANTNDLGEFRIPNLRAGRYTIEARPPVGWHPEAKGSVKEQEIYATTYYPGTLDVDQSVAIDLHPGDETPINFGLHKSRVYRVSGTLLAAPDGGRPLEIMLERECEGFNPVGIGDGGRFEFRKVLPGSYTVSLVVFTGIHGDKGPPIQEMHLSQPIEVSDRDIEGLRLQPEAAGPARGKLRLDTGQKFDWTQLRVCLAVCVNPPFDERASELADATDEPRVSQDGTFELKSVPPGKNRLQVWFPSHGEQANNLRDYFVKSVNLDGRDVSDTGFSASPGMFLDVVIGTNGATIEGTVEDGNGKPVAYVTVVPSAEHLAYPDVYQEETTDEHGHFRLRGLKPGKYDVLAFEELPGDRGQSNFFKGRGEEVQLDEGTRRSIVLKAIPADAD